MQNSEEVIWTKYQGQCGRCEKYHKLGGLFYSELEENVKHLYCPRCGSEAKFHEVKVFTGEQLKLGEIV